ncbi:MAG: GNAT family N-acetyltransferase [Eubacteriales bacterium]|nr:GNAT family N-acetyltransferase [Eubacteriales bacterium]
MIRHGKYEDIPQLKILWKQAFGDEDEYRDDFFRRVFRPEYTLCEVQNGIITAMLYKLPCTVRTYGDKAQNAWYFYALATKRDWRGKGIMGRLIAAAKEEIFSDGDQMIFLIPAEQSLVDYYLRFQFQPMNKISSFYINNRLEERDATQRSEEPAGDKTISQAARGTSGERIFLEKTGLSSAERGGAAELMSRRWTYTNCNVSFPKEIEMFCLDWLLADKESCFYKIVSSGEIIGFLQGNIKKQMFHINYYGMSKPCWNELGSALSRAGVCQTEVLSYINPDKASFSDTAAIPVTAGASSPLISVCARQQVREIHGVIPI